MGQLCFCLSISTIKTKLSQSLWIASWYYLCRLWFPSFEAHLSLCLSGKCQPSVPIWIWSPIFSFIIFGYSVANYLTRQWNLVHINDKSFRTISIDRSCYILWLRSPPNIISCPTAYLQLIWCCASTICHTVKHFNVIFQAILWPIDLHPSSLDLDAWRLLLSVIAFGLAMTWDQEYLMLSATNTKITWYIATHLFIQAYW